MEKLKKIFSTYPLPHHAYGIETAEYIGENVASFFEKDKLAFVYHHRYKNLSIDDARSLRLLQSEKTEKMFIFVLEFSTIHYEAQNALLKVLEEPSAHTHFILIFPRADILLPTLRSRLEMVFLEKNSLSQENGDLSPKEFVAMSLEDRLSLIKKITDKKQGHSFDLGSYFLFLDHLEQYLYQNNNISREKAEALWSARSFADKKGASLKMGLEYLALYL